MRTLKISLLVSILSITISAQEGWFWQNPLPQGNRLRSVCFNDGNIGIAVGDFGAVVKTMDSGENWIVQNSNSTSYLEDVSFSDSYHGTAVGSNGTIMRTIDGGNYWFNQTSGTTEQLQAVHFTNQYFGIAVGENGTIIKTTDGGTNWSVLPSPTFVDLYELFFIDSNIGFIVGQWGKVLKTTDGGSNWTAQTVADEANLLDVHFIDPDTGVIVGASGKFLQTSDGGISWIEKPLPDWTHDLLSVYFTDINNGTAVGYKRFTTYNDGVIIHTTDAGTTWSYNYYPYIYFWGVSFSDVNNGIVVGDKGEIFRTTDGGMNWFDQFNCTTSSIREISLLEENTAVVVGSGGVIMKTTNGGLNWNAQNSGTNNSIWAVHFSDFNNGTAVGSGNYYGYGEILRTIDGGINWFVQYTLSDQLYGVYCIDSSNVTTLGEYGNILRTTDGGNNWYSQTSGTNKYLYDVYFLDNQIGIIVGGAPTGYDGIILRTTDGGNNWITIWSGNRRLISVSFVNESFGIAVGDGGVIIKTTDSGVTWNSQTSGTTFRLNSVSFSDEDHGSVVGGSSYDLGGIILRTTNGGINWIIQITTCNELYGVSFLDHNIGYSVGLNGTILKTINGGYVPVELIFFTATAQAHSILLEWTTASEINNKGFEIERKNENSDWRLIGFVEGRGTTTETKHYNFNDDLFGINYPRLYYRIKQIDYDGTFEYSQILEVGIPLVNNFSLSQNYPNPFNPVTKIKYTIPTPPVSSPLVKGRTKEGFVTLKICDILGREVATLVNEEKPSGEYEVDFNGANLPSGIYFYQFKAGSFTETKKMLLLK